MLRSYWEVPASRLFYILLALALLVNTYGFISKPPTTEQLVAQSVSSVVVIECSVGRQVYTTAGFVASDYGHIVTVAHGLSSCLGARENFLSVRYLDDPEKEYRAKIVKYSEEEDVGILQVPARLGGPYLKISKGFPEVGSRVVIIGHPEGIPWSANSGIVSGNREPPHRTHIIQISAPINHGNSGGPGINDDGEVIGIASFYIVNPTLGFLVSGDALQLFLDELYH